MTDSTDLAVRRQQLRLWPEELIRSPKRGDRKLIDAPVIPTSESDTESVSHEMRGVLWLIYRYSAGCRSYGVMGEAVSIALGMRLGTVATCPNVLLPLGLNIENGTWLTLRNQHAVVLVVLSRKGFYGG